MAMTVTPWVECSSNTLDHPKQTNTPTPERMQIKSQTEGLMWSLKDPDTGRTYWQCIECNYFNKSAKSSKYKVERHVMRHHMGKPKPVRREAAPPQPNGVKKEASEQDRQVEEMMGSLKDPTTSRMIWLCGKCNYSTSNSGKSRSSKFKMKRHILRLHIEGGRASMQQGQSGVSRMWNHSPNSLLGNARKVNSSAEYNSAGFSHKVEAQEPEETVFVNLKAEGGIIDSELKREILKQQQQLLAQRAAENVPNLYYM